MSQLLLIVGIVIYNCGSYLSDDHSVRSAGGKETVVIVSTRHLLLGLGRGRTLDRLTVVIVELLQNTTTTYSKTCITPP